MGKFDTIKAAIDAKINTNGRQAISGHILNNILHRMLDAIGVALADEVKKILGDVSLDFDTLKEIADYIAIDKGRYEQVVKFLEDLSKQDTAFANEITSLKSSIDATFLAQSQTNQGLTKRVGELENSVTLHGKRLSDVEKTLTSQGDEISLNKANIAKNKSDISFLIKSEKRLTDDVTNLESVVDMLTKSKFFQNNQVGYMYLDFAVIG